MGPIRYRKPIVAPPPRKSEDPRIGHLLGSGLSEGETPDLVLLGFAFDRGVVRNGGRPGAAEAPDRIREALFRLTPHPETSFADLARHTRDLGNLETGESVEEAQALLGSALAPWIKLGVPALVLGGGHETAFGHFLGYVEAPLEVEILNWDAHPDVRDLVDGAGHSGSSFRQALTHPSGLCRSYHVSGLLRHSTSREHLRFLQERGASFTWRENLSSEGMRSTFDRLEGRALVTLDMDAVEGSYAPGVSSPATGGLSPDLWLAAARLAGQCPQVGSLDLCEVNPVFDRDGQTARLAALTVWSFLDGLVLRERGGKPSGVSDPP